VTDDEVIAEIGRVEDVRYRAMIDGDQEALRPLLSERLRYTHSSGSLDTKESYLRRLGDGSLVYHSVEHPTDHVTVLDGAVLVAGSMTGEATVNGTRKTLRNSSLAVYAAENGGWALIAYQPTPLP
jgi:Domain of unknown function (DUF4440)